MNNAMGRHWFLDQNRHTIRERLGNNNNKIVPLLVRFQRDNLAPPLAHIRADWSAIRLDNLGSPLCALGIT
jgi:hypothetical protein